MWKWFRIAVTNLLDITSKIRFELRMKHFACACGTAFRIALCICRNWKCGHKSVFRKLLDDLSLVTTVTNFNIIVFTCTDTHTRESHVIYGLHFHAYTKHVVPLTAAVATASQLLPIFRMPSSLRYVTKVSLRLICICIHFQMGIILLPLNCIDDEIWIRSLCVYACAHNEFWGRKLINITISKS